MGLSYNNLWKRLIDEGMNKTELRKKTGMSSSTMAKLSSNESVTLQVLERICAELRCNIGDVMEFTNLDEMRRDRRDIDG